MNLTDDQVPQRENFPGGSSAAIDERERVPGRNPGPAQNKTPGESRSLHQPRRWDFYPVRLCRIEGNRAGDRRGNRVIASLRHDRIPEETACAVAIRLSLHQQHPFAMPDLPDRFGRLGQAGRLGPAVEMALQVRVSQRGCGPLAEAIIHASDDVPSLFAGVEDAVPIAKPARPGRQLDKAEVSQIQSPYGLDGPRYFLSVSSDVLDRRST